jgi:ABC-2 type transport system permease protein
MTATTIDASRTRGTAEPSPDAINTSRLLMRQLRLEQKSFWRNRQSAVFTFALPLLFILLLPKVFNIGGTGPGADAYFITGILGVAVLSATYTTLGISLSFQRDLLVLKRFLGTPLSPGIIFGAKVLNSIVVALMQTALIVGLGRIVYAVPLPVNWPVFGFFLLLAVAAFSVAGVAATTLVSNADSAPAVVQLPFLVLQFISGVFFPFHQMPRLLQDFANMFPLRWAIEGFRAGYLGLDYVNGTGIGSAFQPVPVSGIHALTSQWEGIIVLGAWIVVLGAVAVKKFRWEKRAV